MSKIGLSLRTKIGYGFCAAAESIPGNLLAVYFVFFLTDIVGVRAYIAGIIFFIVLLWDALIDPIIGGLSDNYVTKKGRRLTWMKLSLLPLAIAIFLLFLPLEINNQLIETLFYLFAAIFVCSAYSAFAIPYFALSSEITPKHEERNVLRFSAMIFYYPILLIATSGPMLIWEMAEEAGFSDRAAWGLVGVVFAVLLLIFCGIGLFLLRKSEKSSIITALENKQARNDEKKNYFKIWKELWQHKSFKKIIIFIIANMLGFSMINTVIVYFLTYNMSMSEGEQAVFWVVYIAIICTTLPFVTKLCNIFGKRPVTLAVMIPAIVLGVILFFTGVNSYLVMYLYAAVIAISSSCFFTFYLAFAHDCVEIDEFKTGKRRDGSLSALASLAHQIGLALALPFTGFFLELTGYDGTAKAQSETALSGIITIATIIPALLSFISFMFLWFYPVTKKKYNLLHSALERKRAGEEYSTEGFADIL
ncbi:MAG: MFS transporter [Oscillospiraceae bacterium]|nr:MFS transporter [Oscillospiraceae bacterium]